MRDGKEDSLMDSQEGDQTDEVLISIPKEALPTVQAALKGVPPSPAKDRLRRNRAPRLPPIGEEDQTLLPGTTSFRAITQSFSTSIGKQPPLWQDGLPFDIITPAGKLTVQGENPTENSTLQDYVNQSLGPQGLKHLIALYDVYVRLTQGVDQKQDVTVSAKSLLERIGLGGHATDKGKQLEMIDTAKYLASTFVSLSSSSKRSSPLIIVESMNDNPYEEIWINYHLGIEFYEAVFGSKPKRYVFDTPSVLRYHGKHQEPEIALSFHLCDHLAEGGGHYSIYFVNLCLQTSLMSENDIQYGQNRTRQALRILFALELLEKDQVIVREAHADVDTSLAVALFLDAKVKEEHLAPETLNRMKGLLASFEKGKKLHGDQAIASKRRKAIQNLLNFETRDERVLYDHLKKLTFSAGPRLQQARELLEGKNSQQNQVISL